MLPTLTEHHTGHKYLPIKKFACEKNIDFSIDMRYNSGVN